MPLNYYPEDDPSRPPLNRWRSHAHLLYGNWVSEVYQTTPYDIARDRNAHDGLADVKVLLILAGLLALFLGRHAVEGRPARGRAPWPNTPRSGSS